MTAEALTPLLRAEVRAAAPALPPPSVVSLEDRVAAVLVEERMLAALSSTIGALAAILAAIGIYSMVAAAVARRHARSASEWRSAPCPGSRADGGQRSLRDRRRRSRHRGSRRHRHRTCGALLLAGVLLNCRLPTR